jgi:hypothetical protein
MKNLVNPVKALSRYLEAFSQYCYTQNSVSADLKPPERTGRTSNRRTGLETAWN